MPGSGNRLRMRSTGAERITSGSTGRSASVSTCAGIFKRRVRRLRLALLLLLSATKFSRSTITMLLMALILCDLPWEQSLVKREAYLAPLFQAALGRDEL